MPKSRQLLVGCGNSRARKITPDGVEEWGDLVTVDMDPNCGADVIHDLESLPYPFADDEFDEIHAYEVLEHTGQQGDFRFFFEQFHELWRILKPNGWLAITCPRWDSPWAWGDPSHKRIIGAEALTFLNQSEYERQVGNSSMTDFRWLWRGDFRMEASADCGESNAYLLRAIK